MLYILEKQNKKALTLRRVNSDPYTLQILRRNNYIFYYRFAT
jgi:hypothetical protein